MKKIAQEMTNKALMSAFRQVTEVTLDLIAIMVAGILIFSIVAGGIS